MAQNLSQVEQPVALLFERGDQAILAVLAGQRPQGEYNMNLENVSYSNGELTVDVRLVPTEGSGETVAYPVGSFTLSKHADVNVRLIETGASGDDLTRAISGGRGPEYHLVKARTRFHPH